MPTFQPPALPRHPAPRISVALLAAVALSVTVIASDNRVSRSATPPAERVSITSDSGTAYLPSISADGALVGFSSFTSDGEATSSDVAVRDRVGAQTTILPSVADAVNGQYSGVMSRDGCQIARFTTTPAVDPQGRAYNAQTIVASGRCGDPTVRKIYVQGNTIGTISDLAISDHGRYVAFNNGDGGTVVVLDRDTNGNGVLDDSTISATTTPSVASEPSLGDETLTNRVALSTVTGETVQVFLWDPTRAATDPASMVLVSAADGTADGIDTGGSRGAVMTPDGRYVAFESRPPGNGSFITQVRVRDTLTNRTVLVSRNAAGGNGNNSSFEPSISADGTQIAFSTLATDLLAPGVGGSDQDEGPAAYDLLVARSTSGFFTTLEFDRVSLKPNGEAIDPKVPENMTMGDPVISSNGRWVAFVSTFANELERGTPTPPGAGPPVQVYAIARPAAVTIGPVDFGNVTVGTASAPRQVTVTNTGLSSVLPASITLEPGPFTIVGGGTCAIGAWLSPEQSCTIAVQFTAPAAGPVARSLTIAETGFSALTAAGTLTGNGTVVPTTTTTTTAPTTTTTTVGTTTTQPPTTTTRPPSTTTTTTTVATNPQLTASPDPVAFGQMLLDAASTPIGVAVVNTGTGPADIDQVTLGGTDMAEFAIVADECTAVRLAPGAGCSVSIVFSPTVVGDRVATLTIGAGSVSDIVVVTGQGVDRPTLRLSPDVVSRGSVTVAIGSGFPAGTTVQLTWVDGAPAADGTIPDPVPGAPVFQGVTDANGKLRVQIPVRPDESSGPRVLVAVDQPGVFTDLGVPALVSAGSAQPPTSWNPALPGLPSLINRG